MGNNMTYSAVPDRNVSSDNGKHSDFVWAAATVRGWRRNQEDRYKTLMDLNKDYSYFAVFDGHGGFEIAEYLKMKLHNFIGEHIHLKPDDIELAIHMAFLDFDSTLRHPSTMLVLNKLIEESGLSSTAAQIVKRGVMPHSSPTLAEITREALGINDTNAASTSKVVEAKTSVISEKSDDKPSSSGSSGSANSKKQDDTSAASTSKVEDISKDTSDDGPSCSSGTSGPVKIPRASNAIEPVLATPLQYLLNDELASTDTDDSDFDIDEEESLSEDSEGEMNSEAFMKQEPGDFSGATATVVLVGKKEIHIANVGDSKCVLSRNGQAMDLSVDHNLDNSDERLRVTSAGARISSDGRVNNSINISRAFGDFHLKGSTDIPAEQPVIAEPSVKTVEVEKEDDFVIIASDGIWNSFSSQQLVDFVGQRIKNKDGCLIDICEEVFHLIMPEELTEDGTGCDNMTMIIVKLNATSEHDYLYVEVEPVTEIDVDDDDDDYEEDYSDNPDMDCS